MGVARGIRVALSEGRVLDTTLFALASPLADVPPVVAAALMVPMQALAAPAGAFRERPSRADDADHGAAPRPLGYLA